MKHVYLPFTYCGYTDSNAGKDQSARRAKQHRQIHTASRRQHPGSWAGRSSSWLPGTGWARTVGIVTQHIKCHGKFNNVLVKLCIALVGIVHWEVAGARWVGRSCYD